MSWYFVGSVAAAFAFLAGRGVFRRRAQEDAASASGLAPALDLSHMPDALRLTALWSLADGGFERRVVHGVVARREDVDITAFDLETLRDRRGEWAWLPVEPPYRIGGIVSVVVCQIDRAIPQCLFKREGGGDALADDSQLERLTHLAKAARDRLGVKRSYPAELPPALPAAPLSVALPIGWRAYGADDRAVAELLAAGFAKTLATAGRRDLVVELVGRLVVVYPAARDVVGADAFADLTDTALAVVDGVLAATPRMSPRGIEPV
ncbi:MAG: hypothetical protein KF773_37315 [Deltaproteobacteria bacterium]|nr:hypothetical protein [Deltaproteobacteria bacterium]